ncbi:MAG: peptidoglycan DD-metalloendopeptidase family protein [Shimia sp.]
MARTIRYLAAAAALTGLAACDTALDADLRGGLGATSTTDAARAAVGPRPRADARGIISYPNYQVAVARRGDTVVDVARRIGSDPSELARYNGIDADVELRAGEIIALPRRVAETGSPTGPQGAVDIAGLAGAAIERAQPDAARAPVIESRTLPAADTGAEGPVRHKVARGETAFTIARLYGVSVGALAEWNGLDANFTIREGQFLLIPVAGTARPAAVTQPGSGSATPVPPSARTPQPAEAPQPAAEARAQAAATPTPAPGLGTQTRADVGRLARPLEGPIIRAFNPGRNEGIDIAAAAGTPVKAAGGGTVASISRSTDGGTFMVLRHEGNLLTVYIGIDSLAVERGARVERGQVIARVAPGDPSFLHFEVREGLDAVDPSSYLGS